MFEIALISILVLVSSSLQAQQPSKEARIGYLFPAGACQGTQIEIIVGGQNLNETQNAVISGSGVKIRVLKINQPLQQKRFNELKDYLDETRKKLQESNASPIELRRFGSPEKIMSVLKEAGASEEEVRLFIETRKQRNDPKRQQNPQLSENVILKVEVESDATPGVRELRLLTSLGATNSLSFCIGSIPEVTGLGQVGATLETASRVNLPTILNGWIPPGEVHHYTFQAQHGAHLVVAVQARDLIPYLADAVPGWFQPVIVLRDSGGKEVAYADHFRFNPDPVLCCDISKNDVYQLEIRDALYRGREDFVYRITLGEVPFVTDIFPLGGRMGLPTKIELSGWNLPKTSATIMPLREEGIHLLPAFGNGFAAGCAVFANDSLPQITEPLHEHVKQVELPIIINGHLGGPADIAHYPFTCYAGEKVVAETMARRLNSPLDSWLKITDSTGQQIAFNDDFEDKSVAFQTHSADSHLVFTAPKKGVYTLHLGEAEGHGGPAYAYRLRISDLIPDFAVRIVPSCINARPGSIVPITLYALRKDEFNGPITVSLKDAPPGFILDGGLIPSGQDKVRATLTFPQIPPENWVVNTAPKLLLPPPPLISNSTAMIGSGSTPMLSATPTPAPSPVPVPISIPTKLLVEGRASIGGTEVIRPAIPVDDRTQAFILHHWVPSREWLVVTTGSMRSSFSIKVEGSLPIKIPAGGTALVTFGLPKNQTLSTFGRSYLQLNDPPDGMSIESFTPTSLTIKASNVKPGLKGNLIVETFGESVIPPKDGKPAGKKRYPNGFLPALPFQIVDP